MARIAAIYRHPVKAIGVEPLAEVTLRAGCTLPGDRAWAVAHEAARLDGEGHWAPCLNFLRGAGAPELMAARVETDAAGGRVTFTHPGRPKISLDPERDGQSLIDWVAALVPDGRARPARLVRAEGRGMTDTPFPSVSLLSLASLAALSRAAGRELSPLRFRGNLWLEGLAPWEEFAWMGREIRLGEARLRIVERIERCLATAADPETGRRDTDTLGLLEAHLGHRDFGLYAEVVRDGRVARGDRAELL
ncbi:MAG TPA: MOSC domain-containing protein [Paracoccaceae bacterium]|nr:MOSC domain-containing protein [Paracoccaceae bacterium]